MVPRAGSPLYNSRPYTAQTEPGLPKALKQVGFEQRLNEQVPLDLKFRDETGREVKLGDYFGSRPVVLSLVYYDCPMLCTQVLNGMVQTFKGMSFRMGEQYNVVTVSFDPRERPELAASKKRVYLMDFKQQGVEENWHFLTGDEDSIKKLADAVGFHYVFDEQTNQFAHASGIMVLTPQGKLSRYLYGIEYAPKDVRLAVVEASEGKIGTPVDQLLLYCYHYDPATGKYGATVINMIRIGGVLTIIGMAALLLLLRRRGTHGTAQGGLKAGGAA
ncbi:MAG: SCO family protein [Pyrinomonadaceae bacterium]